MGRDYFDLGDPCGYEQLTVAAASTALATPGGTVSGKTARWAIIQAQDGAVRWRDDGVAPTVAIGQRLLQDRDFVYLGDLTAFRAFREGGAAKLNVTYYR